MGNTCPTAPAGVFDVPSTEEGFTQDLTKYEPHARFLQGYPVTPSAHSAGVITVDYPTGLAVGDVVILHVSSLSTTLTISSFNTIQEITSSPRTHTSERTILGSEPSTFTVTVDNTADGDATSMFIVVLGNALTTGTTPADGISSNSPDTYILATAHSSVSPKAKNGVVLMFSGLFGVTDPIQPSIPPINGTPVYALGIGDSISTGTDKVGVAAWWCRNLKDKILSAESTYADTGYTPSQNVRTNTIYIGSV